MRKMLATMVFLFSLVVIIAPRITYSERRTYDSGTGLDIPLPPECPTPAFYMSYVNTTVVDEATNATTEVEYLWWGVRDKPQIVRIDLGKLQTDPNNSFVVWEIAPMNIGGAGFGMGGFCPVDCGKYVITSAQYLSYDGWVWMLRFNKETNITDMFPLPVSHYIAQSKMIYDKANDVVYVGADPVILKISVEPFELLQVMPCYSIQDMILDGDWFWFTGYNMHGIGKMRTDGTDITFYTTPMITSSTCLAKSKDGESIWFTDYDSNKFGKFNIATENITVYQCGIGGGEPIGISVDGEGYIWISAYLGNTMQKYDPDGTYMNAYYVGNHPFYSIVSKNGKVWCWGRGSTHLNRYNPIVGDVNNDGYTGVDDIYSIAIHFGLTKGQPNWYEKCDVTFDDYIGVDDIFKAAGYFGQEV